MHWSSMTSGRRHSAVVPRPVRLNRNVGGSRVGVAVLESLARRRATYLSCVVVFGGSGHLHCQCSNQRRAEDGENCLSHCCLLFVCALSPSNCAWRLARLDIAMVR